MRRVVCKKCKETKRRKEFYKIDLPERNPRAGGRFSKRSPPVCIECYKELAEQGLSIHTYLLQEWYKERDACED